MFWKIAVVVSAAAAAFSILDSRVHIEPYCLNNNFEEGTVGFIYVAV